MVKQYTHKDLEDVLMEPKALGVKEPFFLIEGDNEESITVVASGKNGAEFNKTLGYFHTFPGTEVYHCLFGHGVMLIQRNDANGECKEIKVVGLRPGVAVEVPSGWGQQIVNTGKNFLVVADNTVANAKYHSDEALKSKHGLCYFVVDKKGNISFENNHNYSFHPQISPY